MSKTRVAFLLPGLGRVQRGAETAFLEVARELNRFDDFEVELFGSGHNVPQGIPIHAVPCISREVFEKWPKLPALRTDCHYEEMTFVSNLAWGRMFKPHHFNVAIACSYPYVNWFLQRTARLYGLRQIFVTQNGDWMCHASSREYRFFGCDGLVCINPQYFEQHRNRYRTALIPNGVDPSEYCPSQEDAGDSYDPVLESIPNDRPVVLMVSALIPSKRVAEGIQVVAEVPDAFLVVAGDGPERNAVGALAKRLLPNRHFFVGSLSRHNMPQLYRRANVFLHMSQIEPFGIVYLEAASTGLPIVASDTPVTRWLLGDSGMLVDSSNIESVAEGLKTVLRSPAGQELGASGRIRVLREWTWEVQAARYRDFIFEMLAERPCAPSV
ncbi:MAG: glycosyltransferase family 4 protein [Gemmataceae bacterium]